MPENSKWKQVKEFPVYWVNAYGQVFNMHRGGLVKITTNNFGQKYVQLFDGKRSRSRSVKKILDEAFEDLKYG